MGRPLNIKRRTIQIRAPKDVMESVRFALPNMSDQDRIRFLYHSSPVKIENNLKRFESKSKIGRFIYGKTIWKRLFG